MEPSVASPIFDAAFNAQAQPPSSFQTLMSNTDAFLRKIKVPNTDNIQFTLDGVLFQISHITDDQGKSHLTIWSILGYLPFSVVSQQKRHILIDILNCTRDLPTLKFGVDNQNRIIVTATYPVVATDPMAFFFMPVMTFLKASLPYINLIGQAL